MNRQCTYSLNRLIYSKGGMNCQGTGIGYETDYTYSAAGRILKKNVTSQRMNTTLGVYPLDYEVTAANVHDSKVAVRLLKRTTKVGELAWEDAGYVGTEDELRANGIGDL